MRRVSLQELSTSAAHGWLVLRFVEAMRLKPFPFLRALSLAPLASCQEATQITVSLHDDGALLSGNRWCAGLQAASTPSLLHRHITVVRERLVAALGRIEHQLDRAGVRMAEWGIGHSPSRNETTSS